METTLYYFSGTGNALFLAKQLKERLEPCEIVPISRVTAGNDRADAQDLRIDGGVIGIIAPIYMHNMPHIVSRFIDRITNADYLFFIYAGGGELGRGLKKTRSRFTSQGLHLSALFNIPMPSNYTPYGYPDENHQAELFSAAARAIDRITETVTGRTEHFDGNSTGFFATHLFPGPLYQIGYRHIPGMDRNFSVDETCTHCGICRNLCPVGNIELVDDRPVWNHRCEQCYACLQWCPVDAIQYGKRTRGVPRYHHPDIGLKEMLNAANRSS